MMRRSQEIECHIVCFRSHMEYITIYIYIGYIISLCLQMVGRTTWAIEKKKCFLVSANVMWCRWPAFEMMAQLTRKKLLAIAPSIWRAWRFVDECTQALCSLLWSVHIFAYYSGWNWSIDQVGQLTVAKLMDLKKKENEKENILLS